MGVKMFEKWEAKGVDCATDQFIITFCLQISFIACSVWVELVLLSIFSVLASTMFLVGMEFLFCFFFSIFEDWDKIDVTENPPF